jgi:hypothetical protein
MDRRFAYPLGGMISRCTQGGAMEKEKILIIDDGNPS